MYTLSGLTTPYICCTTPYIISGPSLYGVALNDTLQFEPCDQISLLYPLLYGVALVDYVHIEHFFWLDKRLNRPLCPWAHCCSYALRKKWSQNGFTWSRFGKWCNFGEWSHFFPKGGFIWWLGPFFFLDKMTHPNGVRILKTVRNIGRSLTYHETAPLLEPFCWSFFLTVCDTLPCDTEAKEEALGTWKHPDQSQKAEGFPLDDSGFQGANQAF